MVNQVIRLLCIFVLTKYGFSARILGIFHMPITSHYILGSKLMKALAERGHDVTMISSFGEKNVPKHWKYRDIVLTGLEEKIEEEKKDVFKQAGGSPFFTAFWFPLAASNLADATLSQTAVQRILNSDEKFDAVILQDFYNDAHKAFASHFGASLIIFNSVAANSWVNPLVGNPSNPSYIPEIDLGYATKMNLWQRLVSSLFSLLAIFIDHSSYYPLQEKIMRKYFENVPDLDIIRYNISLVLLNSHVSMRQPVPHVPNMIDIGGFHISPPEPLPNDLQEYLDNAKDGVIYFSMGSNLKSKYLPIEKREAILKTFAKLKQKVLWKWEDDVLPGKSSNVMLKKWFQQQSILGHPNVKLFITHGGLLSTTETVYHGVPILAMPIFADQEANAATAVQDGYGLKVSFGDLNEETLTAAIHEILDNPKYSENAKARSRLMHDRPMKPLDEAIYWVEYVIRHKGAIHLRSAALDLAWYQYFLVDVAAIIILGIISSVIITVYIHRLIISKLNKKVDKSKRN